MITTPDEFPELRVARLLVAKRSLGTPLDVDTLVKLYADVEYATFPTQCDCLLLRKLGHRPKLIVSNRTLASENRLRFTLAHELGHLVLPWQAGSVFCHATFVLAASDELSKRMEAEANRFAAELLIPSQWVAANFNLKGNPALEVVRLAGLAKVSPITAMFAVARAIDIACLFVVVDSVGRVRYSANTSKSKINEPAAGTLFDSASHTGGSGVLTRADYAEGELLSLIFPNSTSLVSVVDSTIHSTDVLRVILDDVGLVGRERQSTSSSVNGVVGSANNLAAKMGSAQEIMSVLEQRFVGRPELAKVTKHARFSEYLALKAKELSRRR